MADLRLAAVVGGLCRSACGALGCTAAAGVISIGAPATAEATSPGEPRPRRHVPAADRTAFTAVHKNDRHGDELPLCPQPPARAKHSKRKGQEPDRNTPLHPDSPALAHATDEHRNQPHSMTDHIPQTSLPHPPTFEAALNPPQRALNNTASATSPEHPNRKERPPAARSDVATTTVATALLLLLLPTIAAICYPLRRRASSPEPPKPPPPSALRCRPPLDPFTIGAVGLAGPGALATARVMALAALGTQRPSLVVIPRPDVTRMFGLDEDELLDDDISELFIPGNLDAALAYLETELTIRRNAGRPPVPRLLLIADCAGETDRIHTLLNVHRGGVSAVLMGPWTGDRATVTADGVVAVPPTDATLPAHLPTMSRVQAHDLLYAAVTPPPVRRRPTRRSTARRA
ncbi:hypothetical protein AB0L25_22295 [Spirillospora sp. NPDC052242]